MGGTFVPSAPEPCRTNAFLILLEGPCASQNRKSHDFHMKITWFSHENPMVWGLVNMIGCGPSLTYSTWWFLVAFPTFSDTPWTPHENPMICGCAPPILHSPAPRSLKRAPVKKYFDRWCSITVVRPSRARRWWIQCKNIWFWRSSECGP